MTLTFKEHKALEVLEDRIRTILPAEYQDTYDDVQPLSMGSAGLKYGVDGKVAWDEIWGSFCDLAMAGGPPHKGALLEPGTGRDIDARPDEYMKVAKEIRRGIMLVTGLNVRLSPVPGWLRVTCFSRGMAGWLVRAIVMENVAVRSSSRAIDLPVAPGYRLEKEIKNVITVIAKTCHYWLGHMPCAQQRSISALFAKLDEESPLVQPAWSNDGERSELEQAAIKRMTEAIERRTGLRQSDHRYAGWLGVECPSVRAAIWMMRTMVVSNVLARREGTTLFVPVNPSVDRDGEIVVGAVARLHGFAAATGVLVSPS